PEQEDERFGRVTGHVTALTRTLSVAADENRTPAAPDHTVLCRYGELLELIGDHCLSEAGRLEEAAAPAAAEPDERPLARRREVDERLRRESHADAGRGPAGGGGLGALVLQAENLWAELVAGVRADDTGPAK